MNLTIRHQESPWSDPMLNYSTVYTILLRKSGLLKQKLLHATSSYFVLALKKTLPSSSIFIANVICTSNKLGQYIRSQYFCEILWPLYPKWFLSWALYFYSHLHVLITVLWSFSLTHQVLQFIAKFSYCTVFLLIYILLTELCMLHFRYVFLIVALNHRYLGKLITYTFTI